MPEAFIVDAVRTPVGKRGGRSAQIHPADLGAITPQRADGAHRHRPRPRVEDVVMGCLDTIGPQAGDIARTAWLAAGLPDTTPGVTIDRQCGSSQQAVHFAAQAVMAGVSDVVVAAGVQNMSMIPISSAMTVTETMDVPEIFAGSEGWLKRYGDQEVSQFRGADMIAEQWDITRDDMEAFAVESHERAIRATAEGRFERRSSRSTGSPRTRAAGAELGEDPVAPDPAGGRAHHRRRRLPDLRRLGRHARRQRAGPEGPRPHAPGSHPPPVGAGRGPGAHAVGADPGHRPTPSASRA